MVFSFDYIWIMDDDTYPKPDALQNIVKHIGDVMIGSVSFLA